MPTVATSRVTFHLPQAELERIVRDADWMLHDGVPRDEVERWAKSEVAKAVKVR